MTKQSVKLNGRQRFNILAKQQKLAREQRVFEAIKIVSTGKCPDCGAALRRNNSLSGWWQCEQYGTEGFRKDDSKPSCSFQTFTE